MSNHKLKQLTGALPTVLNQIGDDVDVRAITVDSRQVQPDDLFVAVPGVNVDGHRFIPQAVAAGARAVVGEWEAVNLPQKPNGAFTYVRVPNAREAWAWLCAVWHNFPSRKMTLIGVTGTDGKTTTVNLIYHILQAAGFETGMISTVNARIGEEESDTGLHTTTPDPPYVQAYLAKMINAGATHAVLEVTSHGLAQHRVTGCAFDLAVVTNITHEHLDAHGSLEAYQQAKARLFHSLSKTYRKTDTPKIAILNKDDNSYHYLSPIPADRQITYGLTSGADVTARDVRFAPDWTRFTIHSAMGYAGIETPLVGAFNVSNILAAFSTGLTLGIPAPTIAQGISAVKGIPGRMERVDAGQDFLAIVDFAHTPNALKQALKTSGAIARKWGDESGHAGRARGRVIVTFGCAGLRDREKRTMMGHIAGKLADVIIITAEDPRTESLEAIMAETATAVEAEGKRQGTDLWCVPDRGQAILRACQIAQRGDVIIACGKGHEQSMCFGTTEYPWDDREAMQLALRGQTLNTLPTAQIGKES